MPNPSNCYIEPSSKNGPRRIVVGRESIRPITEKQISGLNLQNTRTLLRKIRLIRNIMRNYINSTNYLEVVCAIDYMFHALRRHYDQLKLIQYKQSFFYVNNNREVCRYEPDNHSVNKRASK